MTRRAMSHTTIAPRTFRANAVMRRSVVWAMFGTSMDELASLVLDAVSWARGAQSEGRDSVPNDARPGRAPLPLDLGRIGRGGPRSGSTTRRVEAIGFGNARRARVR